MFLKEVKSTLTQGIKNVFNASYPVSDFQEIFCSIEFPMLEQDYPAIWVGFEPVGNLERGGIDNHLGYAMYDGSGQPDNFSRWRGQGYATFTIGAMTVLQRDRLFDEIVRVLAFNQESSVVSFRSFIEENALIGMNLNFDAIAIKGMTESQGTPWGTSEFIYEATIAVEAVIEFWSDNVNQTLVPLSSVVISPTQEGALVQPPSVTVQPTEWGTAVWGGSTWS